MSWSVDLSWPFLTYSSHDQVTWVQMCYGPSSNGLLEMRTMALEIPMKLDVLDGIAWIGWIGWMIIPQKTDWNSPKLPAPWSGASRAFEQLDVALAHGPWVKSFQEESLGHAWRVVGTECSHADGSENDCQSRHAMYDLVYPEAIETGSDQKISLLDQIDTQRMKILSKNCPLQIQGIQAAHHVDMLGP